MRHCYGRKVSNLVEMSEEFQKLGRENQKNFLLYALNALMMVAIGVVPLLRMRIGLSDLIAPRIGDSELPPARH